MLQRGRAALSGSIRSRLLAGFLGVAGLLVVVAGVGFWNLRSLGSAIENLHSATPLQQAAVELRAAVAGDAALVAEILKAQGQAAVDSLWTKHQGYVQVFAAARDRFLGQGGGSAEMEGGQVRAALQGILERYDKDLVPKLEAVKSRAAESALLIAALENAELGSARYDQLWADIETADRAKASAGQEALAQAESLLNQIRELESQAAHEVDATWAASRRTVTSATLLLVLGTLVGLGLALGIGWQTGNSLAAPLLRLTEAARAMARGDLTHGASEDSQRQDEIGVLIECFRQVQETLRRLVHETTALAAAVQAGDLSRRGTGEGLQGVYAELVEAINRLIEAFVDPIRVTSDYVDRISKGEIPEALTREFRGDFDAIKRDLNRLVEVTRRLLAETAKIAQGLKVGDLEVRADAAAFRGAWHDLMAKFNEALQALIEPNHAGFTALQQAAQGDLSVRMTGQWEGAYAQLQASINALLERMDRGLAQVAQAAEQVASAAEQINSSSQSLAQSTSEQASTLEEVASSLQELSGQAESSAANAREAKALADRARSGTGEGVSAMRRLSEAMERIKASSDETAKIVKTIDEIAFQTNLLALNAAVEAARAGDAGKGFAVVAEEVRNLAMRSAEAAKTTAALIEGSVKNAEGGVALNAEVLRALEEIQKQVVQVSEVMDEIVAGAEQQNLGVQQINAAVEQMNQVTQQSAANAEESSSASEELTAQAEELRHLVSAYKLSSSAMAPSATRTPPATPLGKSLGKVKSPAAGLLASTLRKGRGKTNGEGHLIPFDEETDREVLGEF